MKKEDAIEIMEAMAMAESTFSDEESKKSCEAIDIAIKALKREEAKCDVPLTLEQLRKMDGKPVWVDFTGSKIEQEPGWFILKYMQGQEAHLVGKVNTYRAYEYYGKTWIAYAYHPSRLDMDEWVSVKDDLPEDGEEVIAFVPKQKKTFVGYVIRGKHEYDKPITWFLCGAMRKKYTVTMSVSHWRKKPEEPK